MDFNPANTPGAAIAITHTPANLVSYGDDHTQVPINPQPGHTAPRLAPVGQNVPEAGGGPVGAGGVSNPAANPTSAPIHIVWPFGLVDLYPAPSGAPNPGTPIHIVWPFGWRSVGLGSSPPVAWNPAGQLEKIWNPGGLPSGTTQPGQTYTSGPSAPNQSPSLSETVSRVLHAFTNWHPVSGGF